MGVKFEFERKKNEFLQFSSEAKQEMNFLIWHGLQKRWLKHEMNIFQNVLMGQGGGREKVVYVHVHGISLKIADENFLY